MTCKACHKEIEQGDAHITNKAGEHFHVDCYKAKTHN